MGLLVNLIERATTDAAPGLSRSLQLRRMVRARSADEGSRRSPEGLRRVRLMSLLGRERQRLDEPPSVGSSCMGITSRPERSFLRRQIFDIDIPVRGAKDSEIHESILATCNGLFFLPS